MKLKTILTLLAALTLSAVSAHAGLYAKASILYNDPEAIEIPQTQGDLEASLDSNFGFSGAVGYKFSLLRVEGELIYVENDVDAQEGAFSAEGGLTQTNFFVNGYIDLPIIPIFKPYVGFGIGLATVDVSGMRVTDTAGVAYESNEDDTAFGYQFMAGVRADLPIVDLSLYAGYRYLSLESISVDAQNIALDAALNLNTGANHMVEVGLIYGF
jgi:opacity protein-like surface antigen